MIPNPSFVAPKSPNAQNSEGQASSEGTLNGRTFTSRTLPQRPLTPPPRSNDKITEDISMANRNGVKTAVGAHQRVRIGDLKNSLFTRSADDLKSLRDKEGSNSLRQELGKKFVAAMQEQISTKTPNPVNRERSASVPDVEPPPPIARSTSEKTFFTRTRSNSDSDQATNHTDKNEIPNAPPSSPTNRPLNFLRQLFVKNGSAYEVVRTDSTKTVEEEPKKDEPKLSPKENIRKEWNDTEKTYNERLILLCHCMKTFGEQDVLKFIDEKKNRNQLPTSREKD